MIPQTNQIYRRMFSYIKPFWGRFIIALICMVCVALTTAVSMWLVKSVIDQVFVHRDKEMLYLVVWIVPILYVWKGVCSYGQNYLMAYIGQRIIQTIRNQLYAQINRLSIDFFALNTTGSLISRLTSDAQLLQNALHQVPANIVRDGLTVIFLLGLLFYLHWQFALISIVVFLAASWPIVHFGKKMRKASRQGQSMMAELYAHLEETLLGAVIVRAFNKEEKENKRFKEKYEKYFNAIMRYIRSEALSPPIMELIGALAVVFVILMGGRDVINGVWSTGSFFSFLGAAVSIYQPLKNFSRLNPVIQQAAAGAERIFVLLDEAPAVQDQPFAKTMESFKESIVFSHVTFSYTSHETVLNDLSVAIKKGESIALVGPSGSGKTTMINLLLKFYEPQKGSIRIDGHDIHDITQASLRSHVGVVTQDVVLFNDTVNYNIRYGRDDASKEDIMHASKLANAHNFIMSLPRGYDAVIGERGTLLSGGQKQRISIARALIKNPDILILDEATSSLDAESESLIQDALEHIMKERTVIVIAHRLATVKKVDNIIVIDRGSIIETGRHRELFEKKGMYKKLFELQLLM